jgi:hypothetical protein
MAADVVHRDDEDVALRKLEGEGVAQVRRERRDAALPWRVIPEERNLAYRAGGAP